MKNLKFVTVPSMGSEKVGHICEQKNNPTMSPCATCDLGGGQSHWDLKVQTPWTPRKSNALNRGHAISFLHTLITRILRNSSSQKITTFWS